MVLWKCTGKNENVLKFLLAKKVEVELGFEGSSKNLISIIIRLILLA